MASDSDLAERFGVSTGAVAALRDAVKRGGGRQAQFSHPDLGGMGQWSAGGMTQVGDMNNGALKDKVRDLCAALAGDAHSDPAPPEPKQGGGGKDWWPDGLGHASSTGSQNGMRYACFPDSRRVAVEQGGTVTLYDSGDHRITGVSQQQSATQELLFSSQHGTVRASDLPVVR